jgi:DNA-binding CsgD family transcriptional regulator
MSAESLSALLLDLYRYARELPLDEFQGSALGRLQKQVPFDSAWWGLSTPTPECLIHSSFPYGLPQHYGDFYQQWVSDTDTLAAATSSCPGTTVRFGPHDIDRSPGLNKLNRTFGIRESLCTSFPIAALDLVAFLSLYRHDDSPPFTENERRFVELVAPHMWATWQSNWTANWLLELEPGRAGHQTNQAAHAITDQRGTLQRAEPHFVELMKLEWPDWQGPRLPALLKQHLRGQGQYRGTSTVIRYFPVCGLMLLDIRIRSALDALTPRERMVAAAFGEGQSYKKIAGQLGLSPATVRHYLREIYAKTHVSNKAELVHLLSNVAATTSADASMHAAKASKAPAPT